MSRPADRCPGVFSAHPAADGHLARIRLPGGLISPSQLQALVGVADGFGDAHLELTSRGNLQLRGISDLDGAAELIADAGLIPTPSHERVRNLQLSALTGRRGGLLDARPILGDLDVGLRADPGLAHLPGRFLFGVDDGRGDIVGEAPDAGVLAIDGDTLEIVVGGVPTGRVTTVDQAAQTLLAVADAFLVDRTDEWRIEDLAGHPAINDLLESLAHAPPHHLPFPPTEPLVGWLDQDDGLVALGAVVAHGRMSARIAEFLAAIERDIYFTPRKEIVIVDLSEGMADTVLRVLAPMGLIFDANSPWTRVSACAGSPGCDKSRADVRGDLQLMLSAPDVELTSREHWVGCERGCGSPHGGHTRVEATDDGYVRQQI
ncbi:precorrin-3B synthase [Williamsia soli]|uniref:precorrin-3B synthase n=1 Tax=Williamsia soli TaxID=364929 RepID=UPI001A9E14B4|nr:precorrin-3B synthase [Williamsia soli]